MTENDMPPAGYNSQRDTLPELLPRVEVGTVAERDRAAALLLGNDGGAAVLENIRRQAASPTRNAQWAGLYAEIVGWTGTKQQMLAFLMAQLGVGLSDAQEAVRELRRVPADPHEIARMMVAYADWYFGPSGPGDKPPDMLAVAWKPRRA